MSSTPQFDYDDFCSRMGGNQALMGVVAKEFIRESVEIIALLDIAVEQLDYAEIKRLAHRLKGASAEVSATTLHQASQMLGSAAEAKDNQEIKARLGVILASHNVVGKDIKQILAL